MSIKKSVQEAMDMAEQKAAAREAARPGIRKHHYKRLIPDIPKDQVVVDAKPENGPPAEASDSPLSSGSTTFTFEQVQQMMASMLQTNREAMLEFARELKKPSEEDAAKAAEAKQRKERLIASMIEAAKEEIAARTNMQNACNHRKPNGVINYGGQVHGERVRLICKTCFKELTNRKATSEDIQNGPLELLVENQMMGMNS